MNKRKEKKLLKWCEQLYQDEAKQKYADWLQQATELAIQDDPDIKRYRELKEEMFNTEIHWECCYAPCGYWPQAMRDESFKISCQLHKAWLKINRNKK